MTPEAYQAMKWEREIEERNRPLSDEVGGGAQGRGAIVCVKLSTKN
jgi:hypothetical protein